jgi:hypothetical protein
MKRGKEKAGSSESRSQEAAAETPARKIKAVWFKRHAPKVGSMDPTETMAKASDEKKIVPEFGAPGFLTGVTITESKIKGVLYVPRENIAAIAWE